MQRNSLPSQLKNGLVLWLPGDVSGTTAYDASGSGNNGTLVNTPTSVRRQGHKGYDFDWTTKYITVADAASLDFGSGDFTYSCVAKFDVTNSARTLASKMTSSGGWSATGWNCGIRDVWGGQFSFQFITWNANASTAVAGTGNNFYGYSAGKYATFSFVRRGTTLEIWKDAFKILSATWTLRNVDTATALEFGRYNWTNDQYMDGNILQEMLHNRALSTDEIQLHHKAFFIP